MLDDIQSVLLTEEQLENRVAELGEAISKDFAGKDVRGCIVLAEGINPFYSDLDTYAMMASIIDEAVRRVISVGGRLGLIATRSPGLTRLTC